MAILMIILGVLFVPIVAMMIYMAGLGLPALPIINGISERPSLLLMWLIGMICFVIVLGLAQMITKPIKLILQEVKSMKARQSLYEQIELDAQFEYVEVEDPKEVEKLLSPYRTKEKRKKRNQQQAESSLGETYELEQENHEPDKN